MQDKQNNNIQITGIPQGEKEQRIETQYEKIVTENIPNLERVKPKQLEIAQRVPEDTPKEAYAKKIIIKMSSFRDKES